MWSVATDEPAVALTFDDGPNAAFTPRVLDRLAAAGGRATFFVVGVQVEQERPLVRRLLAEGHELGNHTWAHESPAVLTAEQTRHEIERGTEAIKRVAGQPPRWYRPPRGMVTGSAVQIRESETPRPASLDDTTVLVPGSTLKPGTNTIKVVDAAPTSFVLVWVSSLGLVNGQSRSDIAEITLKAAS